ncbi:MAG: PGF-pre-PGF domain-containing protein [Methanoregula sp.]
MVHLVTKRYGLVLIGLLIIVLALMAPVSANIITIDNSTPNAIKNSVSGALGGDTIILKPGTYFEYGITVGKSLTIQADTANGHSPADTIIDGRSAGTLFMITGASSSLTIDNLTLANGRAANGASGTLKPGKNGGAINSTSLTGVIRVTSSTFTNCSAGAGGSGGTLAGGNSGGSGGAISAISTVVVTSSTFMNCSAGAGGTGGVGFNLGGSGGAISSFGTVTVTSSTFMNCSAGKGGTGGLVNAGGSGGAISSLGAVTVTSSTFTGCSAGAGGNKGSGGSGGAISSATVTVTSSTFTGCSAGAAGTSGSDGVGSAISSGSGTLHFNRIVSNSLVGNVVSVPVGNARNNWWGTNATPSSFLAVLYYNPWLVLGGTATPSSITRAHTSEIRMNLTYNSANADTSVGGIFVPDGIPVKYAVTSGTGSVLPQTGTSSSGANTTVFTPLDVGPVIISATVDSETVQIPLTVVCGPATHIIVSGAPPSTTAGSPITFTVTAFDADDYTACDYTGPVHFTGTDPAATLPADATLTAGTGGPFSATLVTAGTRNITATDTVSSTINGTSGDILVNPAAATHFVIHAPASVTAGSPFSFTVEALDAYSNTATGYNGTVHFTSSDGMATRPADATLTAGKGSFHAILRTAGTQTIAAADTATPAITGTSNPVHVTSTETFGAPGFYTGPDTSDGGDDGSSAILPMTVTVNIGGDSKAWQAIVTGTQLSDLIVTGTVQNGPGSNQTAPPGIVYQYINLVPVRYTTITNTVINFTVPQSWLDENHINSGSIVLYHQTANGWVALPTTLLFTKDGELYFSARGPGFSLFAIAGMPAAAAPVTVTQTPEIFSSQRQEKAPVQAAVSQAPVTTQTTAPPPATTKPAAPSPLLNVVLVIAAIFILAGGGFIVRRWWIQRQNPALFREYD